MRIAKEIIRRNLKTVLLWLIFCSVAGIVFLLYKITAEPLLYAAVLSFVALLIFITADTLLEIRRSRLRSKAIDMIASEWSSLPEAFSIAEEDYQQMVRILGDRLEALMTKYNKEQQDSIDYYTAWVHQIKTPIAVMRLKLTDDTPENRALNAELFRIEQYVDMVLQYIRIGSSSNDLVIREYNLDSLIRESVRKYAHMFVEKRLRLEFNGTGLKCVTDKKWFECILDQLLSNAVKYTSNGQVTIYADNGRLVIADTGIGISADDLPRIFEKGYTGNNGRIGVKSSGLGLYLAKKAADLLSIPLSAESEPGVGSRFIIDLSDK